MCASRCSFDPKREERSIFRLSALLFLLLLSVDGILSAQDLSPIRSFDRIDGTNGPVEYLEGEVIVRFRSGVSAERRVRFQQDHDVRAHRIFSPDSLYHMRLSPERAEKLIRDRRVHPDLDLIQPNYVYRLEEPVVGSASLQSNGAGGAIPDDPEFHRQWGLLNEGQNFRGSLSGSAGSDISATLAWEVTTGSSDVIVAVFDTGIDYEHPDLSANIFRDPLGRPGVDCSPSQLVGGVCGDDPMDTHGHGTHVAGIIGAVGNNGTGIAGLNWQVQLMAIKVFSEDPRNPNEQITTSASILAGYDYALTHGARISNHSYGGFNNEPAQRERIRQAGLQGHLVVASAGNYTQSNGNEDPETPVYPAAYDLDNVISVASSGPTDRLSSFSRYGAHVKIAAPGEHIFSTEPGGGYRYSSGTSMASPHVAGVAALIYSVFPEYELEQAVRLLLEEADQLVSLEERIEQNRRLNAWRSLPAAQLQFTAVSADPDAESVRIELNGRELVSGLAFGWTSPLIRVPAGADLELTVHSERPGAVSGVMLRETVQFSRDRSFRMVLAGRRNPDESLLQNIAGLHFHSYEMLEWKGVPERVTVSFLNAFSDQDPVDLYGFWPEERPPLQIVQDLSFGSFLPDRQLPAAPMELDLTRGDERLDTFSLVLEGESAGSKLVVLTGGGAGEEITILYSPGEGPGQFLQSITPAGGLLARHRPGSFELENNFPNPFRGSTSIQFSLPEEREVVLEVFDLTGRRVQRILDAWMPAGIHRIPFDGAGLSSGLYLYRVRAGDEIQSGKMLLVR